MLPQAVKAGHLDLAILSVAVELEYEVPFEGNLMFSPAQRKPWLKKQTRRQRAWGYGP